MARLWPRRRRTTHREEVAAPPPRPRPFWPWLLLLLALVLGALAASWYLTREDDEDTVPAARVPEVLGERREAAEREVRARDFEVEVELVARRGRVGIVVSQRPVPGTLYGEGGIVVLSISRDPAKVEVPDVTGLPTARALARLRAAELRPTAQEASSFEPKGTVLRQIPRAGTEVPTNSEAVVIVSAGRQLATVPDVVGLTSDAATTRLTQRGFRTRVDRVPGTEPEGTVVAQDPRAGTRTRRGSVVRINVSQGAGNGTTTVATSPPALGARVPNTVGQDEANATATLEGAGFVVRAVNRPTTDPAQDGIVIRQSPAGGGRAAPGSTVTIFVGIIR